MEADMPHDVIAEGAHDATSSGEARATAAVPSDESTNAIEPTEEGEDAAPSTPPPAFTQSMSDDFWLRFHQLSLPAAVYRDLPVATVPDEAPKEDERERRRRRWIAWSLIATGFLLAATIAILVAMHLKNQHTKPFAPLIEPFSPPPPAYLEVDEPSDVTDDPILPVMLPANVSSLPPAAPTSKKSKFAKALLLAAPMAYGLQQYLSAPSIVPVADEEEEEEEAPPSHASAPPEAAEEEVPEETPEMIALREEFDGLQAKKLDLERLISTEKAKLAAIDAEITTHKEHIEATQRAIHYEEAHVKKYKHDIEKASYLKVRVFEPWAAHHHEINKQYEHFLHEQDKDLLALRQELAETRAIDHDLALDTMFRTFLWLKVYEEKVAAASTWMNMEQPAKMAGVVVFVALCQSVPPMKLWNRERLPVRFFDMDLFQFPKVVKPEMTQFALNLLGYAVGRESAHHASGLELYIAGSRLYFQLLMLQEFAAKEGSKINEYMGKIKDIHNITQAASIYPSFKCWVDTLKEGGRLQNLNETLHQKLHPSLF